MLFLNQSNPNETWSETLFPYFKYIHGFFYIVIFILGVIGNLAVCYIISCRLRQSATSIFLLNLSLSDLMMALFCVPVTFFSDCVYMRWIFGQILCHIFPFIQALSVFLSALTHTSISVDRYFVVFHPLRRQNFPIKGAVFIVTCMWIFSSSISTPVIFVAKFKSVNDSNFCHEEWLKKDNEISYSLVVMVLQYCLPLIVIVLTYSAIAVRIWFYQIPGESIRSRDEAIASSKKKMIKMFIIVAIFYTLSQLPRHIVYLISIYFYDNREEFWNTTTVLLINIVHILSMSACCYNPILYIWLNSTFRRSLTNMLTCTKSASLPPTSPKCMTAFPDGHSSKKRMLSISSNNALFNAKLLERRIL